MVNSSFGVNRPEKIMWVPEEPLATIVAHYEENCMSSGRYITEKYAWFQC
jgi:hypothetical protein